MEILLSYRTYYHSSWILKKKNSYRFFSLSCRREGIRPFCCLSVRRSFIFFADVAHNGINFSKQIYHKNIKVMYDKAIFYPWTWKNSNYCFCVLYTQRLNKLFPNISPKTFLFQRCDAKDYFLHALELSVPWIQVHNTLTWTRHT